MDTGHETRTETTRGEGGFQEWESVIGHTIHNLEKERVVGYEAGSETGDRRRGEKQQNQLYWGENNGFRGAEGENTMMKTETSGARFKRGGPGGGEGGEPAQLFKSESLSFDPQNLVSTWLGMGARL